MRKNFWDMKVKDLPHPGQRWVVFDRLLMVTCVSVDRRRETLWRVDFDWIYEGGEIRFYSSSAPGTWSTGSGSVELGRFLHKAERQL